MASSFYANYPGSGGSSGSNPSVGPNGSSIPADSTLIGGENPSGSLQPLQTDSSGYLLVDIGASADDPIVVQDVADGSVTGGAAGTKSTLVGGQFNTALPSLSNSQQAAIQLDSSGRQIIAPLSSSTSSIQTFQATASNLNATVVQPTAANLNATVVQSTAANLNATVTGSGSAGTPAAGVVSVQGISGGTSLPVTATISGTPNVNVADIAGSAVSTAASGVQKVGIVGSSGTALDSAAGSSNAQAITIQGNASGIAVPVTATLSGTSAVNISQYGGTATTLGQKVSASSIPVVIASDQSAVATTQNGSAGVANAPVYNVYSSTNITTSAYVQLIASTTNKTNYIDIFDSSGQAMILATGGSGSEVVLFYVPPGGDQIRVQIPAGTRVAYKALTATASSGYLLMNLLE